jgi:hypothetical protein
MSRITPSRELAARGALVPNQRGAVWEGVTNARGLSGQDSAPDPAATASRELRHRHDDPGWIRRVARCCLLFLASLLLIGAAACSTAPKAVFHSFSFGSYGENRDVEILQYRYGNSGLPSTRTSDWELKTGQVGQVGRISGAFPVGDSLYVKWRVKSTGEQYEDTVDLKSRLPTDMDQKRVHFLIDGPQLFVYLISSQKHSPDEADCPVRAYRLFSCVSLYPAH